MRDTTSYIQLNNGCILSITAMFALSVNVFAEVTTENNARFAVVRSVEKGSNTEFLPSTNVMTVEDDDFFDVAYEAKPHSVSEPIATAITKEFKGKLTLSEDMFEDYDYED